MMTICALTHLVQSGFFVIEFAPPFNPPPEEGGNCLDKHYPYRYYLRYSFLSLEEYSCKSCLLLYRRNAISQSKLSLTTSWKEIFSAEQRAFAPSMEGELKGVGNSYTTYIQKHEHVMPLINKRSKDV